MSFDLQRIKSSQDSHETASQAEPLITFSTVLTFFLFDKMVIAPERNEGKCAEEQQ